MNLKIIFSIDSWISGLILILFFLSLCVWAIIFRSSVPGLTDTLMHAFPDYHFDASSIQSGFIPFWNPYLACGLPQAADWAAAVFYPVLLFWNLTGIPQGPLGICLIHDAWATLGTFLWLQSQRVKAPWDALGAISYAGCALMVYCWIYPHLTFTASWVPWIFWSVQKALDTNEKRPWLWTCLFLGLQILSGYPIFVLYTWFFLVVWFAFQHPTKQAQWGLGLSFLGAGLLSSCQWLPFLEYLTFASRGQWPQFPYFTHPVEYLTLLGPKILGSSTDSLYPAPAANADFNLYGGLIPPFVLVALIFHRIWHKDRHQAFWFFSVFGFWIWMAGPHSPFGHLFPEKFLEKTEPSKSVLFSVFCISTLAAIGLSRWDEKKSVHFGMLKLLIVIFWTLDILFIPWRLIQPVPNIFIQPQMAEEASKISSDLHGGRMLSLTMPGQYKFTGKDENLLGMEKPAQDFLVDVNEYWELRSPSYYFSLWPKSFENIMRYMSRGFPYQGNLFDIAGVRLFLYPQKLSINKYRPIGKFENQFLYENKNASPDMRLVFGKLEFSDKISVLDFDTSSNGPWKKLVYLEKSLDKGWYSLPPVHRTLANSNKGQNFLASTGFQRSQDHVTWIGQNPSSSFLIFNDSFEPGWHAWVDGQPVPILRAYGLFMAVPLDLPGPHQVDFRYEPATFRLGLFGMFVTLSFWIFWFGMSRMKQKEVF